MKKNKKLGNLKVEKRWIPVEECTIKEVKEVCNSIDDCEKCAFNNIICYGD